MSDLLAPFLLGVATLVIVGVMVGMLIAARLDRLTRPSASGDGQPAGDGPAAGNMSARDETEHQERLY